MAINLRDTGSVQLAEMEARRRHEQAREVEHHVPKLARGTSGATGEVHGSAPVDGTQRVHSPQADAELRAILDGPPPLPSSGHHILSRTERDSLNDFLHRTHDGDAALMWDALATMAVTSEHDAKTANDIRNAMQMGKVDSKKAEMRTVEGMNAAERRSSAVQLGVSAASAAVTYGVQKFTDKSTETSTKQEKQANAQAAGYMGQKMGELVTATGGFINKVAGPQAEADKKKVTQMRHQMMQEIFEQGIENAKTNYDEAREQVKLALKILTEHAERATQISTTITRI